MAIFGRKTVREQARQSLAIPAYSSPTDCTPWVIGDLWPAELVTDTSETATLAAYLDSDLRRIAQTANDRLQAISRAGLVGPARWDAETRVVNTARAFAVLRVESTLRQLRRPVPVRQPVDVAVAPPEAIAADLPGEIGGSTGQTEHEPAEEQRLRRLLDSVARQEPGLRWAVGLQQDGTTVLVTDLAHGWIPPGVELPTGVRLLEPGRHPGSAAELVDNANLAVTYAPGDRLGRANQFDRTETSTQPRELPVISDLGPALAEASHGRDGLPRMAHTVAKASATGPRVADIEIDLLRVHQDTARYQLLAQYPDVEFPVLLNCLLLAAIVGLAIGDEVSANYHFAWFQALSRPVARDVGPLMN